MINGKLPAKEFRRIVLVLLLCALCLPIANSHELTPSEEYDSLLGYQHEDLQSALAMYFPESEGFFVTGPLDPLLETSDDLKNVYSAIRVIGKDFGACRDVVARLRKMTDFKPAVGQKLDCDSAGSPAVAGYCGITIEIEGENVSTSVQLLTPQQNRYLIWYRKLLRDKHPAILNGVAEMYAGAVGKYLARIDSGYHDADPPAAVDYGLREECDLYAPPPDYVIEGYQNYKEYLFSYDEIKTEFARGITAFIPTRETLQWFKDNAPRKVFPNKEEARLQEEYRKFLERGGDVSIIQTLTRSGFDTLKTGEYFFAVGVNGNIRFGREIPREEVRHIEEESGRKVPRANHAFLFPGEGVLSAGAFFIDERAANKLVKVNAQSGHYFYSNITSSIRQDIANESDFYLLTLGHFFKALDRIDTPYDRILISKM